MKTVEDYLSELPSHLKPDDLWHVISLQEEVLADMKSGQITTQVAEAVRRGIAALVRELRSRCQSTQPNPLDIAIRHAIVNVFSQLDLELERSDPDYDLTFILVAAMFVGTEPAQLASFSGYPFDWVRTIAARMVNAGMWNTNEVKYHDWFKPRTGLILLAMDMLIAKGLLVRTGMQRNGRDVFRLVRDDCE